MKQREKYPLNYYQKRQKCGKANCRTCREQGGHGPYWYASRTVAGRTVDTYIGKELPFTVPQPIGRREPGPLVGRADERKYLEEVLHRIEGSRPLDKRTKAA